MMKEDATLTHVITRLDRVTRYSEAPAMESQRRRVPGPRFRGDDSNGKHI
jgi:hypothetical protein